MTTLSRSYDPCVEQTKDRRLAEILDRYLAELDAGRNVDRAALLAEHADLAKDLADLLDSLQFVSMFQHSDGLTAPSETLAPLNLGDFRLLREIGRGGMGVVYEAEQLSLGRSVALKVLPFAAMLNERQLARFKNEARAAAGLQHPHIVPVYSVGVERGVHYYAMQLILGQSLAEAIEAMRGTQTRADDDRSAGVSPSPAAETIHDTRPTVDTAQIVGTVTHVRRVAELGIQAAEALQHAHDFDVLHRDIKPSNLLLDPTGHLWITDFGLARLGKEATLTLSGDFVGTLRYMSPEQVRGKAAVVDGRSDIYSLGVTLYELLTLRPAFECDESERLVQQILLTEPLAPRSIDKSIPGDLETIVLKAIRKDAEGRFATAQELADDLRRFLDAKPILARRQSFTERLLMWSRRHAGLVMIGGAALLTITLIAVAAAIWVGAAANEKEAALRQRTRETERANERTRFAKQVVDEMYTKVAKAWLANAAGMTPVQREFLDKAAQFYRQIAAAETNNREAQYDAALADVNVAEILFATGSPREASQSLGRSIEVFESLVKADPDELRYHNALAASLGIQSTFLFNNGQVEQSEAAMRRCIECLKVLAESDAAPLTYRWNQATSQHGLALSLLKRDPKQAEELFRAAMEGFEYLAAQLPDRPEIPLNLARPKLHLARLLAGQHRHDEARLLFQDTIDSLEPVAAQPDQDPESSHVLADAYWGLGYEQFRFGDLPVAIATVTKATEVMDRLCHDFPERPQYREYAEGVRQSLKFIQSHEATDAHDE